MIYKCPKCGNTSLIRTPHSQIMTERLGSSVNSAKEYSMDCLHCKYTSGIIRVKTEAGLYMELPWYKKLFK